MHTLSPKWIMIYLVVSLLSFFPSSRSFSKDYEWSIIKNEIKAKDAEKLKKARTFIPKEEKAFIYSSTIYIAAVYTRHIDFYVLPAGVKVVADTRMNKATPLYYNQVRCGIYGRPVFLNGGKEISLKPHKIIRFTYNITSRSEEPFVPGDYYSPCIYLLVATNMQSPLGITSYSDEEEREYLALVERKEWKTPKGDYDEFYGMFSIDGTLIFRAKEHAAMPDKWINNWCISPNGEVAIFAIGRALHHDACRFCDFRCVRRVLYWKKGKGIDNISLAEVLNKYPKLKDTARFIYWTRNHPGGSVGGCE